MVEHASVAHAQYNKLINQQEYFQLTAIVTPPRHDSCMEYDQDWENMIV